MISNYLRIALRHLLKQRFYTLLNIIGLAISIAVASVIFFYVTEELSYDRDSRNHKILRISDDMQFQGDYRRSPIIPDEVAPLVAEGIPSVQQFCRINRRWNEVSIKVGDQVFFTDRFFYADSTVHDFFSFDYIYGDPKTALVAPHAVILTEEIAQAYYGDRDPVGETFEVIGDNVYRVTGVINAKSRRSHFNFDVLASYTSTSGSHPWVYSYLKVPHDADEADLKVSIDKIAQELLYEKYKGFQRLDHSLMAIEDIHLGSNEEYEIEQNGNAMGIYVFATIGVFLLLLATINYINLTTAVATMRFKEIGVKKVMGCGKKHLYWQFTGESLLLALITFVFSVGIFEIFHPIFLEITGWSSDLSLLTDPIALGLVFSLSMLIGLLASIYPSVYLSSISASSGLKPGSNSRKASLGLRGVLVIFQFTVSAILIFGTLIINHQLDFMSDMDLGFEKEQLVAIPVRNWSSPQQYESLKAEWSRLSAVEAITFASNVPTQLNIMPAIKFWEAGTPKSEASLLLMFAADETFINTLGIEVIEGRDFNKDLVTDQGGYILNEAAVEVFGSTDPVGMELESPFGKAEVIGVVKDFHFASLHAAVNPMVIFYGTNPTSMFAMAAVRLARGDLNASLDALEKVWQESQPGIPFEFFFMDDKINEQYQAEYQQNTAITVFSVISILISSLGILGLVAFTAERRVKEIGIRKVLGADVLSLIMLLFKRYALLIGVALVIALPIGYMAMDSWLTEFIVRINITPVYFIVTAFAVLAIAAVTALYHSLKAASGNPVKALRFE